MVETKSLDEYFCPSEGPEDAAIGRVKSQCLAEFLGVADVTVKEAKVKKEESTQKV